jgi:hypothetical protein
MKPVLSGRWAETPSSQRREPTALEISNGFPCGPWDLALFNELNYRDTDTQRELGNLLTGSGLTASEADQQQVLRAVRGGRGQWVTFGGTTNAWTVTRSPVTVAGEVGDGYVLVGLAPTSPTGALTLAMDGGAAESVTWHNSSAVASIGVSSGQLVALRRAGSGWRMHQGLAPDQVRAIMAATALLGGNWSYSQSMPNASLGAIAGGSFTAINTNLGDATFTGGTLTMGPNSAGTWYIQMNGNVPAATTDLFLSIVDLASLTIASNTGYAPSSATATQASIIAPIANGQGVFFRARQSVGSTQTVTGRVSAIRLGN